MFSCEFARFYALMKRIEDLEDRVEGVDDDVDNMQNNQAENFEDLEDRLKFLEELHADDDTDEFWAELREAANPPSPVLTAWDYDEG